MSTSGQVTAMSGLPMAEGPVRRNIRVFVAPIDRTQTGAAGMLAFDVASAGTGERVVMPAGWLEATGCRSVTRRSMSTAEVIRGGSPAGVLAQVRTAVGAELEIEFADWGKLQTTLASAGQVSNVLAKAASGASVTAALAGVTSTATVLQVGATGIFAAGDVVVVDVDYAGQTGYVGAGAAGAYVSAAQLLNGVLQSDVDFVRRVSVNVGVVASVSQGTLTLAAALPAGVPGAGMRVSKVMGFADRDGGGFVQEWSGVVCFEGEQGDRLFFFYPRLLSMGGVMEGDEVLGAGLHRSSLVARLRAMPATDPEDGTAVVCTRTYVPAPGRLV